MTYNTTGLMDSTNLAELFAAVNTLSGNTLGVAILIIMFVFAYVTIVDTNRTRIATASIITSIAAGLMLTLNLISPAVMWIVAFMTAASIVILYVNSKD